MPIYEYVCDKCGEKFEMLQKSCADQSGACPTCGAEEVKKQLSSFSSGSTSCASSG